jgi:hypothetical protein
MYGQALANYDHGDYEESLICSNKALNKINQEQSTLTVISSFIFILIIFRLCLNA